MFRGIDRTRTHTDVTERLVAAQPIGDDPDHHPEPGCTEAEGPAYALAEDAGNQGSDECADVDPHVEDREPGVAPRAAFRIEVTDDCRDIRLEKSGAHH